MVTVWSQVRLELSYNGFTGSLPPFVWASGDLEHLMVTKNNFTGTIPCPSHAEPMFKSLYLGRNQFTYAHSGSNLALAISSSANLVFEPSCGQPTPAPHQRRGVCDLILHSHLPGGNALCIE